MEGAGTLSIPYGKQAAFAGRLGLTGDVRRGCSVRKRRSPPFRAASGMAGKTKSADRSPPEAIGAYPAL